MGLKACTSQGILFTIQKSILKVCNLVIYKKIEIIIRRGIYDDIKILESGQQRLEEVQPDSS